MSRETHVRFWESAGVRFPRATQLKELIRQFNAGLIDAEATLDATEELAKEVLAEDEAHKGSGLGELAFGIHAILEKFKGQPVVVAEPHPTYDGGARDGGSKLTAIQQAALAIDSLYASDETAPPHWQEKSQLKKGLRGLVRRLVKDRNSSPCPVFRHDSEPLARSGRDAQRGITTAPGFLIATRAAWRKTAAGSTPLSLAVSITL